jgi:HAD superfamily hydrolase (TIGR01457 family)
VDETPPAPGKDALSLRSDSVAAPRNVSSDGWVASRYDAIFLDLDGVVYRGDQAVPGASEVLERLRALGVTLLFLTNNSSRTPDQVATKLARLGVRADPAEVLTSGLATAAMLRREGGAGQTAFVIGEQGVREALSAAGIRLLDGEPDRADLVVVGWDRSFDYAKLRTAALLVQRGARLVATNADATYPAPDGLWPGGGAILAAITTATGATPTVVGKPARPLFEAAAQATGARRPLVVGDRLDTDVAGAEGMGWDCMLVLTGASRVGDLLRTDHLPTYLSHDLRALVEEIPPARFRATSASDVAPLEELLASAGLSTEGVEDRLAWTVVSPDEIVGGQDPGGLAATACVEKVGELGLLRSVAVRPDLRGDGLGALAVARAARGARRRGLDHLWLFTETAEPFFARLGFRRVDRDALPEEVRRSRQAQSECAATAVAMSADLGAAP